MNEINEGTAVEKNIHLNDKTVSLWAEIKVHRVTFCKVFFFFSISFYSFWQCGDGEIVGLYTAKEIRSDNSSQLYSPRNMKSLQVKEHIILPGVY